MILGPDDLLLLEDTVDGSMLGVHAGRYQRYNLVVPDEYAGAAIHVYLWDAAAGSAVGEEGQTFAVRNLGVQQCPALGNAEWTISTELVATQQTVRSGDLDTDGMLDAWELAHFGAVDAVDGAPDADPDRDGWSNLKEYLLGTAPRDADSALRLSVAPPDRAHLLTRLTFPSVTGRLYRIEFRADLTAGPWSPLATGIPGTGAQIQIIDPESDTATMRFYRIALEP